MRDHRTPALLRLITWLMLCSLSTATLAAGGYTIVLASAKPTGATWKHRRGQPYDDLVIYVTAVDLKGQSWERLNLGFFDTRRQAGFVLETVSIDYPGAWIRQADAAEIEHARATRLNPPRSQVAAAAPRSAGSPQAAVDEPRLRSMMASARQAYKDGNYRQAVRFFSAITLSADNEYRQEALELLGLSRQRLGQRAQAARIYEQYLEQYPDSDGADRVQQRLSGLLTETMSARAPLRLQSDDGAAPGSFVSYGSVSQFYRHDSTRIDSTGSITTLSQLISFADLTGIYRSGGLEHRYQLALDNTYDFLEDSSSEASEFRISELNYEFGQQRTDNSLIVGRQRLRVGSLINRFDGLSAGYGITADYHLTLVAGAPVEIDDKTTINDDKRFYGFIFDTGTFLERWNARLFHFSQTADGIDDRTNSGAEVTYRDSATTVFGIIDYDSLYDTLNTAYLNASHRFDDRLNVHLNMFRRKTPPISTSNALIGQTTQDLDVLLQTLNIEQVYQLARDRTADNLTSTAGGTWKIDDNYQVNLDLTLAHTSSTPASMGVPATDSTGTDFFLSSQLVGNNLFMQNDTGVLGFRYYNTKTSDTLSLIANSRFPIGRDWRIYPRIQYDIRNRKPGGSQKKTRYFVKTDYRFSNRTRFDFEIGYDDISEDGSSASLGSNSLFYSLGYRTSF